MRKATNELKVMFEGGGASVRSLLGAGMYASIVEIPAGADFTAALKGLPGDLCPSAHWGYVLDGTIHLRYADGSEETCGAGDIFYWPAGHTASTVDGARFVEVSREAELTQLLDHMRSAAG